MDELRAEDLPKGGWQIKYSQEMRVRVLLFGVLKDRLGAAEQVVDLGAGATVGAVMEWARAGLEDDGLVRTLAVAVNREYAGPETPVREGDEVALLPPVSGGSGALCGFRGTHV